MVLNAYCPLSTAGPKTTLAVTLMVCVATAFEVAVMVTVSPGGGTRGAVYTPCEEMLPISPPRLLALAIVQFTGTVVPVETEENAVQERLLFEATTKGEMGAPVESSQITAVMAVAASMVTEAVAVSVDCTWEVAVMVMTLFVGTADGAV